jgi:cytochrome c
MMMGTQAEHPDLKAAPPEGQVTAIKHCADTYALTTADGKTNKVWEFNLRFKTDSSTMGPHPGKPVIVGAGMQGDRASVVFAAPGGDQPLYCGLVPVMSAVSASLAAAGPRRRQCRRRPRV